MFEKCGVLDILYAVRKYAIAIVAVMCACFLLGLALTARAADASTEPPAAESAEQWVASACYEVSTPSSSDATVEERHSADAKAASTLLALVKADFTRETIYHSLLQTYSKDDFVKAFSLPVAPADLTPFDLSNALQGSVLNSTSVINLCLISSNKQLSNDYLELAKDELAKLAKANDISLSFCGGVLSAMKTSSAQEETIEGDSNTYAVSPTKYWLILPLLGFVLSLLVVIFKAMFFPTVNRRSDVVAYDLPVIAEVDRRIGKKRLAFSLPFNALQLADCLKENNVRTCAVVTTLKNPAAAQKALTDMVALLQEQGRAVVTADSFDKLPETAFESALVFAGNLNTNIGTLETVSRCDCVLLAEQYGTTTHRAFYEMTDILQLRHCNLIGVATVQ